MWRSQKANPHLHLAAAWLNEFRFESEMKGFKKTNKNITLVCFCTISIKTITRSKLIFSIKPSDIVCVCGWVGGLVGAWVCVGV